MSNKDELKQIYFNPIWFTDIVVVNDFTPFLRVQFFGNDEIGGFHLHCDGLPQSQKKYKYIDVTQSNWSDVVRRIKKFMSLSKSERYAESGWVSNTQVDVSIKTLEDDFEVHLIAVAPNGVLCEFINSIIDLCPILNESDIVNQYYC